MAKLKDIIITDDFIEKASKAKEEVKDLNAFLLNLNNLNKEGQSHKGKSKEVDAQLPLVSKQIKEIEENKSKIDLMIKNMEGLKKISDPKDNEIPIIDDDPIMNFLNRTKKAYL